ncbi:hypothetical protein CR969_00310 [Candidatus Saccharibacteria bacterium]|nr:MAG: hypothetical protein CR969_00310 [Candidatus Saccharibacteria bacterium]
MPGRLALSNGELNVVFDDRGLVDEIYFPYVGHQLHTRDCQHKIGVWINGKISWLTESDWQIRSKLLPGSLIAHTIATNRDLNLLLEFEDLVDSEENVLIRNIHVVNLSNSSLDVRLFLHQAFHIGDTKLAADTAQFIPDKKAILHYQGRRAFVVGGQTDDKNSFDQFSIGRFGQPGLDGTWRDAEDGDLSGCSAETGSVDSTIRFSLQVAPGASTRIHYWLAAGTSPRLALAVHKKLTDNGIASRSDKTARYWHRWLNPSFKIAQKIDPKLRQPFINSLLSLRSRFDPHGAIVDAHKMTCRPQTAAYILWPLIRLGYTDEALRFFSFCKQALSVDEPYLLPSYRADGAWDMLPGAYDGDVPPIEIKDSALVLFIFSQYCSLHKRSRTLNDFYKSLVTPLANFLTDYTDPSSNLVRSRDTYDTAIVYGALNAAATLADRIKDSTSSVRWRSRAEDLLIASQQLIENRSHIPKSLDDDSLSIEAIFGCFMFGLVELDDEVLVDSVKKVEQNLNADEGLFKISAEANQPDLVASLWMAQYYLEVNQSDKADSIIKSITKKISKTGAINDDKNGPASAEYISTLLDTITKN